MSGNVDGDGQDVADWVEVERQLHADCRVYRVERRRFRRLSDGRTDDFFVVKPADWAVALGRTEEGQWLLVRQFRFGPAAAGWECPSGCAEPGEDAVDAARRELLEETGFDGSSPVVLGRLQPNPGMMDNTCAYVLFQSIRRVGPPRWDPNEEMEVRLVDEDLMRRWLVGGQIQHALMHAGLHLYDAWKQRSGQR